MLESYDWLGEKNQGSHKFSAVSAKKRAKTRQFNVLLFSNAIVLGPANNACGFPKSFETIKLGWICCPRFNCLLTIEYVDAKLYIDEMTNHMRIIFNNKITNMMERCEQWTEDVWITVRMKSSKTLFQNHRPICRSVQLNAIPATNTMHGSRSPLTSIATHSFDHLLTCLAVIELV